jgi:hypothetical protein
MEMEAAAVYVQEAVRDADRAGGGVVAGHNGRQLGKSVCLTFHSYIVVPAAHLLQNYPKSPYPLLLYRL